VLDVEAELRVELSLDGGAGEQRAQALANVGQHARRAPFMCFLSGFYRSVQYALRLVEAQGVRPTLILPTRERCSAARAQTLNCLR
jgi:hypothetical protein